MKNIPCQCFTLLLDEYYYYINVFASFYCLMLKLELILSILYAVKCFGSLDHLGEMKKTHGHR